MINPDEERPKDQPISAHADLGEIAMKLETTVSGISVLGDQAMLQVASLKRLNASLKAELEALDALRREHAGRQTSASPDQGTHQDEG